MWLRAEEYIDVDDDCLIVTVIFGGRARYTGIDVRMSPAHVFRMRDGRALQWHIFENRAQALKAADLQE